LALCCASLVASRWENRCVFVSLRWVRCSPATGWVIFVVVFGLVVVVFIFIFVFFFIVVLLEVVVVGVIVALVIFVVVDSIFCVCPSRRVDADLVVECR
jgi:hypothetical protein